MSKKKATKAKEDFIMVYYSYMKLRSKNVGADEIILLGLIGNLSQTMDCIATNKTLALYMNVNERTIGRYLKNLQADNLIRIEQNGKAKSHRTISINNDIINEKCQYGGQGCPCDEPETEINSEGVDKVVHVGGQSCPSGVDSSGFENADNTSNANALQSLIEKKIEKRKEKNIQPASQSVAPANAVAKSSATADGNGASHLEKEKLIQQNKSILIKIMGELVDRSKVIPDKSVIRYGKEYDEYLLETAKYMIDNAIEYSGVKINTVDDVIKHFKTFLN